MPISSTHAFSSFLKHRTPNLEQITLENLGITHLPENPCLSHLKEISLTNLPFLTGDSFVLFVDAHPTIKTLSARQMNLDDWLGDLIKLKELDILDLSGSELTRESLLKFQKYTEIKKIITEGTKFTEDLSSEDGDE